MAWSLLEDDSFAWPKELNADTYKTAEKLGKLKDLMKKLDDGEKLLKGIDFPYAWVTSNPVTHLNWQNHALKFLGGPAKTLGSTLAGIKSAADKSGNDKAVSGCKESRAAALAIAQAANAHVKYVQFSELEAQVQKANKLCREAHEADVQKKTGIIKKACRALTSTRHPCFSRGAKIISEADQFADRQTALSEAAFLMSDGCEQIVVNVDDLIKAKKSKNAMVKGLKESDYVALARIKTSLKPYMPGASDWTRKLDVKAMSAALKSMKSQAGFFDQVVRKMVSK